MIKLLILNIFIFTMGFSAFGYEGPSPLQKIKVDGSASIDSSNGLYLYDYKIMNPTSNDGGISEIRISIGRNSQTEAEVPSNGLSHCPHHSAASAQRNLSLVPMVPVGSATPNGWSCHYMPDGSFSFGSIYSRNRIKPGSSLDGLVLKSYAPPGIREIKIEPGIDSDLLPDSYNENVEKLEALEKSVIWIGKTIGPKAPPKVFAPLDSIAYLISLKEQALSLGWIREKGIANSLDAKLNDAKKKIASGDNKTAKNVLGAFQNEVQAQNGKKISAEAYALLYFNAKYLIDRL